MFPTLFYIGERPLATYGLMLGLGIISALGLLWLLCARQKMSIAVTTFYAIIGVISIGFGLFGAWAMQAIYITVYNAQNNASEPLTGLTFMGGLLFGAITFCLLSYLFAKPNIRREFWKVLNLAVPCLAIALAFGRMGCFFGSCCFGRNSDWGIYLPALGRSVIPTNMFEALFAFVMCIVMLALIFRANKWDLNVMIFGGGYAIFRFGIEFVRADQRWQVGDGLSPSQIQSIALLGVVIALVVIVQVFKLIPYDLKRSIAKNRGEEIKDDEFARELTLAEKTALENGQARMENGQLVFNSYTHVTEDVNNSYARSDVQQVPADEQLQQYSAKSSKKMRNAFFVCLGAGGLLAILGLALIGNPAAVSFLLTFSAAAFAGAAATMPLRADIKIPEPKPNAYYSQGRAIIDFSSKPKPPPMQPPSA